MPKIRWTEPDLKLLKEMLENRKSTRYIASHFGISVDNLRVVMSNHGFKVRKKETGEYSRHFKNKKLSISQRIMELTGLEVKDSTKPRYFTDEQLLAWREGLIGFKRFCLEVLDIELQKHQDDIAKKMLNNRHSCFVCGRRSGKTFLSALYVLWRAIISPSERICLISPSYESSLIIFKQILVFVAKSEELRWDISKDTCDELEFRNKSNIKSLSAQSMAIRGRENSIVLIDEVSSLENEQSVMASVSPSLASRKGSQLILISTPRSKAGILWDSFNSPLYATAHYPSQVNKFLDLEWLELEKNKLPVEVFNMEYLAEWSDAVDSFFPFKLINRQKEKYDFSTIWESDKLYYLGIDIGRLHDYSQVVVLSKKRVGDIDELKVENIITFDKVPFQAQITRFIQIFHNYNCQKLEVENAGLSMPVVEDLKTSEISSKLVAFTPTIKSKEDIYMKLLKELELGNLTIPDYPPLINEMRNFQFVYTPRGVKLHHSSSSSDDILDALTMAVHVATKKGVAGRFYTGLSTQLSGW